MEQKLHVFSLSLFKFPSLDFSIKLVFIAIVLKYFYTYIYFLTHIVTLVVL